MRLFASTHRSSQREPDEGKYVAYWNRSVQLIASHPISSAPSVPNWVRESPLNAFKDVSNNKRGGGRGSPNEPWIIPEAKGSISAGLSPRSSIWFISFLLCFSALRGITEGKAALWRRVAAASSSSKTHPWIHVINASMCVCVCAPLTYDTLISA